MEWYIANENTVNGWIDCGFLMKKCINSSSHELPWAATWLLNHATVVVFQLYVSRLPVPPFFWSTKSKGRNSFALSISMSIQAKLWMNFQVNILMKNNPLYINDSNVLNDLSTTTQIQFHCLSRLLVICILIDSNISRLLNCIFQIFSSIGHLWLDMLIFEWNILSFLCKNPYFFFKI